MESFEQQTVIVLSECPDCGATYRDNGTANDHACDGEEELPLNFHIPAEIALVIAQDAAKTAHSEGYHEALDAVVEFASRHSFKKTIAQVKLWNANKWETVKPEQCGFVFTNQHKPHFPCQRPLGHEGAHSISQLRTTIKINTCQSCGQKIKKGDVLCPRCGKTWSASLEIR